MVSRLLLAALMLTGLLFGRVPEAAARQMDDMDIVVLRTIDKISARTNTFEVPVEKTVKFGASLFIKARACRKSAPMEKPESAAFLQIWERKPKEEKPTWVFSGWMFASNPSLSAMDHPVYDVWVIDCKNATTSVKPEKFSSEATPEGSPEAVKPEETKPDEAKPDDSKSDDAPEKDDEPDKEGSQADPED